jgi:hypothetical protein
MTHDPHARPLPPASAHPSEVSSHEDALGEPQTSSHGESLQNLQATPAFSLNLDELMSKARQAHPDDGTGDPALAEAWDDEPDPDEARTLRASAYVEGDMEPDERARFEAELAQDPALRQEVERLRHTLSALQKLSHAAPSEVFLSQVEGKIRQRSRGRFFGEELFPTRFPFEAVVGSVLVVLAVLYLYARHTEREPATFEAMSGPRTPDAGTPDAGARGDVGARGEAPKPAVLPLRQEVARYTLVLRRPPGAGEGAEGLAKRIEATHRAWKVTEVSPGVLEVRLPAGSAEDFMESFGAGGELRMAREVLPEGAALPAEATIRVELVSSP